MKNGNPCMMMKKMKIFFAAFAVVALAISCTQEAERQDAPSVGGKTEIRAAWAEGEASRTVLAENGTDILWSKGEEINLFYGWRFSGKFTSTNTEPQAIVSFVGDLTSVTGYGEQEVESSAYWAVYPYDAENFCDGESVTLTLSQDQSGKAGSFADKSFPAVASSNTSDLAFYNVCGGARFSVTREGVKRVVFRSNNGSPMAGTVQVGFGGDGKPQILEVFNAKDSVVVNAPDGGFIPGVNYFAAMLPQIHEQGLTVTLYTASKKAVKVIDKSITVRRSTFGTLDNMESPQEEQPYSAPSFQVADLVGTSYSWYNLLYGKKKEFIYPHILTSYIASERYRWDNMEYILMGEIPKGIEVENIGNPYGIINAHAYHGYWHIRDMAPNAVIKACGGTWSYLKPYLDEHPEKLLMVSCASDSLFGDTVEELRANPDYQVLKDILTHDNCILSISGLNVNDDSWLILNEEENCIEGGIYQSSSVNSEKNNKLCVVGYDPMRNNIFGEDEGAARPLGFENANHLVFPFMQLVTNDYVWGGTTCSFPTAALSGTLGNFLSVIMKNRPGTTLEGAMTVMKSNYLIQDTFKYKNDQGEIVDGEHWYFFDTDKFIREEILHESAVESALSGSGTVVLPSVGGLCYEGPGVQFTIGDDTYESVEANRSVLEAAVIVGTPVEWSHNPALAEQIYGISGTVTITVRVMDTHAQVVPDVTLTLSR